jgi:hypothetical protein
MWEQRMAADGVDMQVTRCPSSPSYDGPSRWRILSATEDNYLSGFWGWDNKGYCAIAFHNSWMKPATMQVCPGQDWLLSSGGGAD